MTNAVNYRLAYMNTFAKEFYRTKLARKQGVLEAGIGAASLYRNFKRYLTIDILKNVQKVFKLIVVLVLI